MIQQKNQSFWKNIAQEYHRNVGEKIINPVVFDLLENLPFSPNKFDVTPPNMCFSMRASLMKKDRQK